MSEFDTKQPRIPGYVAMNPDGSFTAVPSVGAPDLLRYCGDQPGDDWVKRVERLNAQIDHLHKILKRETGKDGYCFTGIEHPDGSVSVTVPASFVPDELKVVV